MKHPLINFLGALVSIIIATSVLILLDATVGFVTVFEITGIIEMFLVTFTIGGVISYIVTKWLLNKKSLVDANRRLKTHFAHMMYVYPLAIMLWLKILAEMDTPTDMLGGHVIIAASTLFITIAVNWFVIYTHSTETLLD